MTMIGGRRTFLKRSYPYLLEDDGLIGNRANALQYVQVTESDVKIVSSERMASVSLSKKSTPSSSLSQI